MQIRSLGRAMFMSACHRDVEDDFRSSFLAIGKMTFGVGSLSWVVSLSKALTSL
jgi:hypothetical protein